MERHEVIIVGGGPAGASCAGKLRKHGIEPLVLDRDSFPRLKLCAGWITPEVVADLAMDPATYPGSFLTFERLQIHLKGLRIPFRSPQHSIRRVEFDAWLLERSGAEVRTHNVKQIARDGDSYVIDDTYRCRWLVGAGGTRCPVYRQLFRETAPRDERRQAAALEHEIPYDWQDGDCHLWFFKDRLPGYSWYVPKAGGHLNAGVGGVSALLAARGQHIKTHWQHLTAMLADKGLARNLAWQPKGYTYYVTGAIDRFRIDNAFVCGDAAGLATGDMAEGIGPAIRSGIHAADTIAADTSAADTSGNGIPYERQIATIPRCSLPGLPGKLLDMAFSRRS